MLREARGAIERIELDQMPEGQGAVVHAVPAWRTTQYRHRQRPESILENRFDRDSVLARARHELAQQHSRHAIKPACVAKRRERSIDSIRRFAHVLEEQHRARQRRRVGRADESSQDREVTSHQWTLNRLADIRDRGQIVERGVRALECRDPLHALHLVGVPKPCDHRRVQ